ncbi:hypothetical protein HMPREF1407_01234 [Helicobacter pylori GAM244Ai]|nr:hypothetical protein HMPREF1407_01234 [Helicobacter pylori GAM244Ai]
MGFLLRSLKILKVFLKNKNSKELDFQSNDSFLEAVFGLREGCKGIIGNEFENRVIKTPFFKKLKNQ